MDRKIGTDMTHQLVAEHPLAPEAPLAPPKTSQGALGADSMDPSVRHNDLVPHEAPRSRQNPYEKLTSALTDIGNLRAARQREIAEQSTFTKIKNFLFGDSSQMAHDSQIDQYFKENPQLALHELSAGDWSKTSGRYLHFDADGNLSVRDSKPKGHDDTAALRRLSYWLTQHAGGVDNEHFDSLKDTTKQLYQRKSKSREQDEAYVSATKALYRANPERAKTELLSGSDTPRFATFDELGNAAFHDVKPRGYDHAKELQGFQRWVQSSGTELSSKEARQALVAYQRLEGDARANAGLLGRPDWDTMRSAVTDAIYRKAPQLAHEDIRATTDWGKAASGASRYLHVSSDGKSASVREQRPKSHTENFRGLAQYVRTLDPADSGTPAVIKGIQKYVEQFGKEAWTSNKERDAALSQLNAQIAIKSDEGAKVRAQARAAQEAASRDEIFRLTHQTKG